MCSHKIGAVEASWTLLSFGSGRLICLKANDFFLSRLRKKNVAPGKNLNVSLHVDYRYDRIFAKLQPWALLLVCVISKKVRKKWRQSRQISRKSKPIKALQTAENSNLTQMQNSWFKNCSWKYRILSWECTKRECTPSSNVPCMILDIDILPLAMQEV